MDDLAKLFAGHMGVVAVLANVFADKRVIGASELSSRMREAHDVASECAGAPASGQALAEMVHYLGRHTGKP